MLLITTSYLLLAICLFIYSYGFVDLNLTLSSNEAFLGIIGKLQHLVYFDRALSGKLFLIWASVMTVVYLIALKVAPNIKKFPWKPVIAISLVFTLAYPLFSHDIFNYMFHSKIVWLYHKNPYVYPPLYFEGDPWLRFMRWVHTTAAYGPGHTLIYLPIYGLGMGKFSAILLLAKLIPLGFYFWSIHLLGKISALVSRGSPVISQLAFALNPLILLETLASGHNDGIMMTFYLLGLFYFLRKNYGSSVLAMIYGAGVKVMTVIFLPMYLLQKWFKPRVLILLSAWLFYIPLIIWIARFQPWYLVWFFTAALAAGSPLTLSFAALSTITAVFYYYPYISTGFWDNSPKFVFSLVVLAPLIFLAVSLVRRLSARR